MPTSFTFDGAIGISLPGSAATPDTFSLDVTALVDDGSILPGDEVVLRILDFGPPFAWTVAGLTPVAQGVDPISGLTFYEAPAFYYGSRDFLTGPTLETGYVFGAHPDYASANGYLISFDDDANFGPILFGDVENWNQFQARFVPLTSEAACFLAGTMIATPAGGVAVEDLRIGDRTLAADGRAIPVRWIGRQTVKPLFAGPRHDPVRIRAGALGAGVPMADLIVTADHGMIIDGLVINAGALVNGVSISVVPLTELADEVTFYHIETEAHDVILANGAPAETFIDYVGRQAFGNYAEYLDLYGCERIIPEMGQPRISSRRLVPAAILARLDPRPGPLDVAKVS